MQATKDENDISPTPTAVSSVHDHTNKINIAENVANSPLSRVVLAHAEQLPLVDIEHVVVQDDPRKWSTRRKTFTLGIISSAGLIATLGIAIYNPAINDIKSQLHATDQQISLTLSVFILFQGVTPLFWSAISEIQGRKLVYLVSVALYLVGCGVAGSAKSIEVLIAMRVVQAVGGSAVISIGAATLADIYEPQERGIVVGIYYAAPLLGPSIGPLIGGVVTELFSWRATFYFLVIFAGLVLVLFVFFKDTFRRERSLSYQIALHKTIRERQAKLMVKQNSRKSSKDSKHDLDVTGMPPDLEAHPEHLQCHPDFSDVRLSLWDINPFRPFGAVLRRFNNITILVPTGLLYGFTYCITYTAVLTLAAPPYSYNALEIGLVLLSFGVGSMGGSVVGGRWSDHILSKLKAANNGKTISEDRLQGAKPMMFVLPASLLAYAWMAEKKIHIAALCVILFLVGFSSIWIYSCALAYIVDANVGRSSTAVATNSFFRCIAGFIAAETAVPLQDALGDGGLYSLWAALMVVGSVLILFTIAKGVEWREIADSREKRDREEEEKA